MPASLRPGRLLAPSLCVLLAPRFCIAATDDPIHELIDATLSTLWMQPYYTLAGLILASSIITLLVARRRLRNRQPGQARRAMMNGQDSSRPLAVDRPRRESEKRFRETFDQAALEQANSLHQGLIETMRNAAHAMDRAKQRGRDGNPVVDPATNSISDNREDWAARIAQALHNDELCLLYQPIVNMREGAVAGVEALVRCRHPDHGLLLPNGFLPSIEGSELTRALDRWVLQRAITDLAGWFEHGLSPRLHVNLSAHSLLAEDFVNGVQTIVDNTPSVTGDQISLEILETAALEDLETVTGVIRRCKAFGLRFALDEFGTGYSSLTYFRHLPADTLKIDQSFVRNMLRDQGDLRLVESVIGMARAFDRTVVAEGVESEEHGTMLLRFGCDLGQGDGIGRPMPSEEVAQWLHDYQHPRQWRSATARVWRPEDLPLLTMEAEHRGWVERLIQPATGDSEESRISTDGRGCRFGRWYQTDGMRQYGQMDAFKDIDALHQRVHKLGENLLDMRENGEVPDDEAIEQLRMASNALIDRLTMLQEAVIERHDAMDSVKPQRRPHSKGQEPLDLADPDWASPT